MQTMEYLIDLGWQRRDWGPNDVPPAARSYLLRVLMPKTKRHHADMSTLCGIMDLLAMKKFGEAADLASQRSKATELAELDGNWARARFLQLIPPEDSLMCSQAELNMAGKELERE